MYFHTTLVVGAGIYLCVGRVIKKQIYYFNKIRFNKNPGELLLMFNENVVHRYINNVTNMIISGQRFVKHIPTATNRCGINTRCYEGRSLQINSI
jgi:hypothetical protein